MGSLRIGILSALFNAIPPVSWTIPGTQLVFSKYLRKKEEEGRIMSLLGQPWVQWETDTCAGEVDRWQRAAISAFSNWWNLWSLPRRDVVLRRELGAQAENHRNAEVSKTLKISSLWGCGKALLKHLQLPLTKANHVHLQCIWQTALEIIRTQTIATLIKINWASTVRIEPFFFKWVLRKHPW